MIDVEDYRRMRSNKGPATDFKQFLQSGPSLDGLHLERSAELARTVELE